LPYLISKNSNRPYFGVGPNALSSSSALGTANNTAFAIHRDFQVLWTGAKYAATPDLDLIAAYYHEQQNSFAANHCTDSSQSSCSGSLDAVSFLVDWRFAKRWDAYAGMMYSQVRNGLANGFLSTSAIDPTLGVRFQF
jgi:predicted porin